MNNTNKNFFYNIIYQIFTFIIPLIITPYISRKLGVDNIGIYSYTYSIVYYFMLITLLGINNHGSRTIAKLETKEERSKGFLSIYYIQLFLGLLMLVIYNTFIYFNGKHYLISLIQNLFLLSAILDINWYFFGREKFKLTISRNIIIKLFSLVLILLFVNNKNDLWKYTFIMSGSTLFSQLYLWFFIRKEIKYCKVPFKNIFANVKPCIILFIPVIAYSIYKVMDKTMLGAISGTIALGYYENAEKIINIPISFSTALGTVMLPHMSKNGNSDDKIIQSINSSLRLIFFIIIPMIIGITLVANDFSIAFFGNDFYKSGVIMQLLAPTIIFTAIANILRTNYLIPQKKEKVYVAATVIGALVNLIINFVLIPKYSFYGACIGTIVAEFIVMFIQLIYVKKIFKIKIIYNILPFIIKSLLFVIVVKIISLFISNLILRLIFEIIVCSVIYVLLNIKYIRTEIFNK